VLYSVAVGINCFYLDKIQAMNLRKKLFENLARREYLKGDMKSCRRYLLKSRPTKKNVVLFVTSYLPIVRKYIIKNYKIFDIPYL